MHRRRRPAVDLPLPRRGRGGLLPARGGRRRLRARPAGHELPQPRRHPQVHRAREPRQLRPRPGDGRRRAGHHGARSLHAPRRLPDAQGRLPRGRPSSHRRRGRPRQGRLGIRDQAAGGHARLAGRRRPRALSGRRRAPRRHGPAARRDLQRRALHRRAPLPWAGVRGHGRLDVHEGPRGQGRLRASPHAGQPRGYPVGALPLARERDVRRGRRRLLRARNEAAGEARRPDEAADRPGARRLRVPARPRPLGAPLARSRGDLARSRGRANDAGCGRLRPRGARLRLARASRGRRHRGHGARRERARSRALCARPHAVSRLGPCPRRDRVRPLARLVEDRARLARGRRRRPGRGHGAHHDDPCIEGPRVSRHRGGRVLERPP